MSSPSALLDTSFLISLVSSDRPNHLIAKSYFQHMVTNKIAMHFSAIAASEFSIRQPISQLPLSSFRGLPFSIHHGIEAGRLWKFISRDEGDARYVVRDDIKLVGQAVKEGIDFLFTEDKKTLFKHCERLRLAGEIKVRALALIDGFDISHFNQDGQVDISSVLSSPPESGWDTGTAKQHLDPLFIEPYPEILRGPLSDNA